MPQATASLGGRFDGSASRDCSTLASTCCSQTLTSCGCAIPRPTLPRCSRCTRCSMLRWAPTMPRMPRSSEMTCSTPPPSRPRAARCSRAGSASTAAVARLLTCPSRCSRHRCSTLTSIHTQQTARAMARGTRACYSHARRWVDAHLCRRSSPNSQRRARTCARGGSRTQWRCPTSRKCVDCSSI